MMLRHHGKSYGSARAGKAGSRHYYRPTWTVSSWDQFVRGHEVGLTVQVCTGASRIGVARVDILASVPGVNVVADCCHLPLRTASADTVVCDPPYEFQYPERVYLQRELFRVARQRVIFKAPWIPRGKGWMLKVAVLLASHTCANCAVLSVLDRTPSNGQLFPEA